jgi:hypothetical protein
LTKKTALANARRTMRHPLYGDVPLVRHEAVVGSKRYEYWRADPGYKPTLPRGAVEGDVAKQIFCPCHTPKYFYLDEERSCVQCGAHFTFSGHEQKYWYEVRKFNVHSVPIRCPGCRRLRRSEHALREQIARARADATRHPADVSGHLALARALVEYHERTEQGNLDEAIAAARRAAKLRPDLPEAALWEGIAQVRRGRVTQGRERLMRFLERARRLERGLESRARAYLRNPT